MKKTSETHVPPQFICQDCHKKCPRQELGLAHYALKSKEPKNEFELRLYCRECTWRPIYQKPGHWTSRD